MSVWTVTPDTVRYDLDYGGHPFWVELKKYLTVGEEKRLFASGFRSFSKGDSTTKETEEEAVELNVNWDSMIFMKVRSYLTDWSLTDDKGRRLPRSLDSIHSLKSGVFRLIEQTVDKHVVEMRELEKKVPSAETKPEATSA